MFQHLILRVYACLIVSALLLIALGTPSPASAQAHAWQTVEGKGFRGVIMDADTALLSWRAHQNSSASEAFTPDVAALRQLEAKLRPAIETSDAARIEQLRKRDLTTYYPGM